MALAVQERSQLDLSLGEGRLVQHTPSDKWRGYCTLNFREPGGQLQERPFLVDNLQLIIERAARDYKGCDVYLAQHSYAAPTRRTDSLLSLNIGHIDLDTYRTPVGKLSPEVQAAGLVHRLREEGQPTPSYIVFSGRGLQAKYLWTAPLPAAALPRWQAAHRQIVADPLWREFGADERAILPTQLMRLAGSTHSKSGEVARVVWCDGTLDAPRRWDFDEWCERVLPFSREQVAEFRVRSSRYKFWDGENARNRAKAARMSLGESARSIERKAAWGRVAASLGVSAESLARMDDLVAGEIWQRRLKTMDELSEHRWGAAGVPEGQRHEWVWVAATALAWVNQGQPQPLLADLLAWAKRRMPGYTAGEVKSAAGSVLKRVAEKGLAAEGGVYRMTEATWHSKIGLDAGASQQIAAARQAKLLTVQRGVMEFEPMRGLTFKEYVAETRSRQAAGGKYAASVRSTTRPPEMRARATELAAGGMSQRAVAAALGVSAMTVCKWLKKTV